MIAGAVPAPMAASFDLRLEVWLHPGAGGWHFVTLPQREGEELRRRSEGLVRGWGAIPVTATLGKTTWTTSLFPDAKSGSYLLPIKAKVREAEQVFAGDTVPLTLRLKA